VEYIFSPFLYKKNLTATDFMKSKVLPLMLENYHHDPTLSNDWSVHTSYGTEDKLVHKINWDFMKQYYNSVIQDFSIEFFGESFQFQIDDDPWYTVYGEGQNGPLHDHIDADFSLIHYLKFDPNLHVGTTFVNPNRIRVKYHNLYRNGFTNRLNRSNIGQSLYFEDYTPNVQEGDVLIFPASLEHKIEKSNTDELRVVVALNFKVIN
jgi:hypothetical protein